jgi:hypothetical protein
MTMKGAWTPDKVRERIKTGVILDRLEKHTLGELDLTQTQLKAAEILLRKTIPDLKAVEHSGDAANPVKVVTDIVLRACDSTDSGPPPGNP